MKYKKYPKYKDSGVEWIGEIPEEWEINKIKFYFEIKSGKTLQSTKKNEDDIQVPYITAGNVFWDKIEIADLSMMNASSEEIKMYQIQNGDLLVSEGGDSGRSAIVDKINFDCIIQNHVHRLRPLNGSSSGYLENVLKSIKESGWFDALTKRVTMNNLPSLILANIIMPVPSEKEQYEIHNFLQKKKIQFDELIAKSKEQITILEEKRQATINQAVTKGLDPSVKMKDSGVEWIGDIPEGWEVKKIKEITDEMYRYPTYYDIKYLDNGILEIRGELILADGTLENDISKYRKISHETSSRFPRTILHENDFVFSVRGTMGKVALISKEFENSNITANLMRLSPKNEIHSPFLLYVFHSFGFNEILNSFSPQTTIKTIKSNVLASLKLALPPIEEQKQISDFLDKQTTQFDELIAKSKKQITILEEKRQALITAVVTGKIDVRN